MNTDKFWKVNLGTRGKITGDSDDRVLCLLIIWTDSGGLKQAKLIRKISGATKTKMKHGD